MHALKSFFKNELFAQVLQIVLFKHLLQLGIVLEHIIHDLFVETVIFT